MNNNKTYRLGDICEVLNGKAYKQEELLDNGKYKVLRVGNFFSNNSRYYSDLELDENKYCNKGDLLFAWSASFGPRIWDGEKTIYHYHIWKMVPNELFVDKMFLYYLLKLRTNSLLNGTHGSIMLHITKEFMEDLMITIPEDVNEQRSIALKLSTIDDKIELNNKINSELEAMAKELYEYWFVQFDFPDENGKPYKSSGGKMVWNDGLKREIPEGWSVEMIKDTFGSVGGYSFSSDDYVENGKYKLYTIGNVQDGYIVSEVDNYLDYLPDNMPEECLLKPGEMLMSLTGNVGRVGFVYENNALLNQRVLKLQSEKGHKAFMYMTFIQDSMRLTLERISNGTSQKNLSPINMGKLKMIVPPEEVLKKYDSMCNPMIDKMVNNFAENQKLTELRDFLLPMLMNGQVTVK